MKILLVLIVLIVVVYVVICTAVYFFQERLLFFTTRELAYTPALPDLEDVYIKTSDGEVLNGWYLSVSDSVSTVLYLHGNAGNISDRTDIIEFMRSDLGCNCLMIDYRGYGKSTGKLSSESEFYKDVEAAYLFLKEEKKVKDSDLIIWGRSLGSGAAVEISKDIDIKLLIIDSGFYSLKELASEYYGFLPLELILRYRMNNGKKLSKMNIPVIIFHSRDDEVISFRHAVMNFKSSSSELKRLVRISGGHNESFMLSEHMYSEELKIFLRSGRFGG